VTSREACSQVQASARPDVDNDGSDACTLYMTVLVARFVSLQLRAEPPNPAGQDVRYDRDE
jgi:hypothetical protein